jgi:hypothetical protein
MLGRKKSMGSGYTAPNTNSRSKKLPLTFSSFFL